MRRRNGRIMYGSSTFNDIFIKQQTSFVTFVFVEYMYELPVRLIRVLVILPACCILQKCVQRSDFQMLSVYL